MSLKFKSIISNPYVAFVLGATLGIMAVLQPLLLVGCFLILVMVLYAFRDRIDFEQLKKGEITLGSKRKSTSKTRKVCSECGSATKHKITCSQYGRSKKRVEAQ